MICIDSSRTGLIDKISSTLDLLSFEAFHEDGIRRSVWKVPFTNWMPLFINKDHGERALPLLKKSLAVLCQKPEHRFKPEMALEVLPKLMNTMVVNMMSGNLHGKKTRKYLINIRFCEAKAMLWLHKIEC